MYLKTENGVVTEYPYRFTKVFEDNPNTSFPRLLAPEILVEYGIYEVIPSEHPVINRFTQMYYEGTPVWDEQLQGYKQVFVVEPISVEKYKAEVKVAIAELEGQITQRRLREAVLGQDGGWLATQETKISDLRIKLS